MAHHHDAPVRAIGRDLIEMTHDARLQLLHAFPLRWTRGTPRPVPALPQGIFLQRRKWTARPVADINFVDGLGDLDRQAGLPGDRLRRLARPVWRSEWDGPPPASRRKRGSPPRLFTAIVVEARPRHARHRSRIPQTVR